MVASAIFITDLSGKPLISRNYRGDIPLSSAAEKFATYLLEADEEAKKPVFYVDGNGEFGALKRGEEGADACGGVPGGETFVYIQVSFVSVLEGSLTSVPNVDLHLINAILFLLAQQPVSCGRNLQKLERCPDPNLSLPTHSSIPRLLYYPQRRIHPR